MRSSVTWPSPADKLRTVLGLLRAAHPEPGIAVTAGAVLLAIAVGHGLRGTLIVGATVAASQLAAGWHNDWLDVERDTATSRTDKPIVTGAVARRTVGLAAVAAILATVAIAVLTGPVAAVAITVAVAGALVYNWPLKRTPLSIVPYIVSFALLPSFVVAALPGAPAPPPWLVAAGGLLGAGAHLANALPDLDDDTATGVRGLPHMLGPAWSRALAAGLLLAATAVLAFGPPGPPSWAGIAGLALAVAVLPMGWYAAARESARGSRPVAVFRAVLVVALVDVVLLVASGRLI